MITRSDYIQSKILDHRDAAKRSSLWKMKGSKVVFTNGCFDILHKGHVSYLAEASELGNKMIVALNTDASVKLQGKGDDRPINNNDARASVLASLGFVDMVVFFDANTPIQKRQIHLLKLILLALKSLEIMEETLSQH